MRRVLYLHEVQKRASAKIVLRTDKTSHFRVGRSLENTLVIEDINVSKYHCLFLLIDNFWYIQDESSNGTWLNNFRLDKDKQYQLQHGDIIKLSEQIKFKYEVVAQERLSMLPERPPTTEVDFVQQEFKCNICGEMYIKAMTLSCSHTFCQYCIEKWHENSLHCPNCAAPIIIESSTLVLDNYIDAIVKNNNTDLQEHRSVLIKQRDSNSLVYTQPILVETIELTNTTGAANLIDNHNHIVDYDAAHAYYCRKYGKCYLCDQKPHESATCGFRRP